MPWGYVAIAIAFTLSTGLLGDCSRISKCLSINTSSVANSTAFCWRCTPPTPLPIRSIIVGPDHAFQIPDTLLQSLILLLDLLQLRLVLCNFLIARGADDARATDVAL
jgi:hypothetical protein